MADELDIEGFEFDADRAKEHDPVEARARAEVQKFFEEEKEAVFFSRQIEILFEGHFFHWITARVLRYLVKAERIRTDNRALPSTGGAIHLFWNRKYRYYRRAADELVGLVSEYADPNVAAAIGIHGEGMVLEAFAKEQFVLKGRETSEWQGRRWTRTNHDFDFIFERDGLAYAVEVKNTLGYPVHDEISTKLGDGEVHARDACIRRADVAENSDKRDLEGGRLWVDLEISALSVLASCIGEKGSRSVEVAGRFAAAAERRYDEAVYGLARQTTKIRVNWCRNSQQGWRKSLEARIRRASL